MFKITWASPSMIQSWGGLPWWGKFPLSAFPCLVTTFQHSIRKCSLIFWIFWYSEMYSFTVWTWNEPYSTFNINSLVPTSNPVYLNQTISNIQEEKLNITNEYYIILHDTKCKKRGLMWPIHKVWWWIWPM